MLVRVIDGSAELVRVRIADGAALPLTATPDREESWPYWSPAARRLVFQVRREAGKSDLAIWSEQDGERLLGNSDGREERWPTWSPHGAELAWAFRGGRPAGGVMIGDFSTGEKKIVARSGQRDLFLRPSWSPLGDQLVAQRRLASGAGSRLWLIPREGGARQLTRDPRWFEFKPHFTRDARCIVYSRRRTRGGPSQIAVLELASGERRRLARHSGAEDHSARPSPTRDEVAFVSTRSGRPQIHVVGLHGDAVRQLADIPGAAFAPRWSPDGERIVVTVAPPGEREPRLADQDSLAGARVVVLDLAGRTLLDAPGVMPDWMPAWR